jgi:hypothetical protein
VHLKAPAGKSAALRPLCTQGMCSSDPCSALVCVSTRQHFSRHVAVSNELQCTSAANC